MFAKDEDHLSLFFQGHPEYDSDTLAREFRRDVARALRRSAAYLLRPPTITGQRGTTFARACRAHGRGRRSARVCRMFAMSGPQATWRERWSEGRRQLVDRDRSPEIGRERRDTVADAVGRMSMSPAKMVALADFDLRAGDVTAGRLPVGDA